MGIFLTREFINGITEGNKTKIISVLLAVLAYRYYKLIKFTYFELKKRDAEIDDLKLRMDKQEEKEL